MKKSKKRYSEMNLDQLREATKEFDQPSDNDYGFKALTPAQRTVWNRVKRGPGRPKIGDGAANVLISIERGLLKRADHFAKQKNLSRSALVALGIRTVLANGKHRCKSA